MVDMIPAQPYLPSPVPCPTGAPRPSSSLRCPAPRPESATIRQVWVLDSLPGQVRAGGGIDGPDHPGALIELLRTIPQPIASRNEVIDMVVRAGEATGVEEAGVACEPDMGVGNLGYVGHRCGQRLHGRRA